MLQEDGEFYSDKSHDLNIQYWFKQVLSNMEKMIPNISNFCISIQYKLFDTISLKFY